MKTLLDQLSSYGSYHTKLVTKITHYIGIPMVVFSILIALAWVHLSIPPYVHINLAWLLSFFLGCYYIVLDWRLGIVMLLFLCLRFYLLWDG
jgi:uncharacterized membrane protein YGL010W